MTAGARTRVLATIGSVAGLVVVYALASVFYLSPAGTLRKEIDERTDQADRTAQAAEPHVLRLERLREIAATTLGRDPDLVRHRFRTALSSLAEECGLEAVEVDETGPTPIMSPVAKARITNKPLSNEFRGTADFAVFRGELSGEGSVESVLRTMAVVQAQPWAHRVDGFGIKPENAERTRFSLRIDVTTLYLPDLATDDEPVIVSAAEVDETLWRSIADGRGLQHPAPAPTAAKPPAPAPKPRRQPGLGDWRLSGVIVDGTGVEVMITHISGGQFRSLRPGDEVLGAVLVGAEGEHATFRVGEDEFGIWTGHTLAQRDQRKSLH
jgi:hypothetical protein